MAEKTPESMPETTLNKAYDPADVEARWGAHWEAEKTFTPDPEGPGEPYSIVIPPPNVTGQLHIGHALNLTLQDILCRFHRQRGRKVLWVPGTDHAGIATQNVVERALKAEGSSRAELGREKFIERVWEWRKEYGGRILNQVRRLGASVDWTRERFTMDEGLSKAVRAVFVRLYNEGLIYRGEYIVNWCSRCHTALADDEVEFAPKKGALYHIAYPLADGRGSLTVATTRPETMLGDVAVAVHPEDARYRAAIGRTVRLPLVDRELPVIADAYVDKEFGTGCLKITPAHDMNDWEIGRKHGLPVISVMDEDGNMNENAPEKYRGMAAEACRKAVVKDLEALGLLISVEEHPHNVGECYRCKTVIEPHVSQQWFVGVKPLALAARKAVETGDTTIFPQQWEKTYYNWLDNIRDWCISRQIWWGHRIPAWTCEDCGEIIVAEADPTACTTCGSSRLTQEEDVLDTWFSSALWPFSTMGWPEQTKELKAFYPTAVLVTAFDILFFWVARMMMMGIHFMEEVPFRHVYIHALVRDAEGKKMSKSTGNVIDPLAMTERYGTDALRFTLASFAAMGRDIKLSEERIEGYRHFVNKLWNAARFALMNLPEQKPAAPLSAAAGVPHRWILNRLEEVKDQAAEALEAYRFNDYAQCLYAFTWREFCDWYLELAKPELAGDDPAAKAAAQAVLWTVLKELLTLLHPAIPFVTSEIWSKLPGIENPELATEPYPAARPQCRDEAITGRMALLQDAVVAVRNIRAELSISPGKELDLLVRCSDPAEIAFLNDNAGLIRTLAKVGALTVAPDLNPPKAAASAVVQGHELFVPLAGAVDFAGEVARLDKELGKVRTLMAGVDKKLANPGFTEKAPADVVQKERDKRAAYAEQESKLAALRARMAEAMEG